MSTASNIILTIFLVFLLVFLLIIAIDYTIIFPQYCPYEEEWSDENEENYIEMYENMKTEDQKYLEMYENMKDDCNCSNSGYKTLQTYE